MRITGRTGRQAHVNGTYEPLQIQHNKMPCWVARAVRPIYLFHSGKGRWVVSKSLDDGSRCYVYAKAVEGRLDPATGVSGAWSCCDTDGQWREDPAVKCEAVPASTDQFVQLRMKLEGDMRQYGLIERSDLKALWRRLDFNGNGIVSLAEIDKMVVELVAGGSWPSWLNNKPALMRAYKKTTLRDGDGDDWVQKREFHALLLNIFWFNRLWQIFSQVDAGQDRRISLAEFTAGLSNLGIQLSQAQAQQEFQSIDSNHGGQVLFVEFCAWVRKRINPDDHPGFDADIASGEHLTKTVRRDLGDAATNEVIATHKCFRDFDELEKEIKLIMSDHKKLHKLWERIDFNGNNIVSLAEIDKLVVEAYPLLNHKPALMRAYKATIKTGDKDDWVDRKEFKTLLGSLFYFNKLYWLFDQGNGDDRRMTFPEFKRMMSTCGVSLSESEAHREFSVIDRNGGGMILFDEFCKYFTCKHCPECLTQLVG